MFVSFNAPRQIGDRRVAVPISDARRATEIAGRPTRSAGETRSVLRTLAANQAVKNPWRRNSSKNGLRRKDRHEIPKRQAFEQCLESRTRCPALVAACILEFFEFVRALDHATAISARQRRYHRISHERDVRLWREGIRGVHSQRSAPRYEIAVRRRRPHPGLLRRTANSAATSGSRDFTPHEAHELDRRALRAEPGCRSR